MPITTLTIPLVYTPIYNKIAFAILDSNYTTANYKYNVEVTVNGIPISYQNYYPRLTAVGSYPIGHLYVDISSILRNYVDGSYYTPSTSVRTSLLTGGQEALQYNVVIRNQSTTLYTSGNLYAWVGCPSYLNSNGTTVLNKYVNSFAPNITTPGNVLNFKNYNRIISLTDYATVSVIPGVSPGFNTLGVNKIEVKSNTGKTWTRTYNYKTDKFLQIGIGPKNINESLYWTSVSPVASQLTSTDTSYTVKFYNDATNISLKTLTFNIKTNCKYKRFKIDYQAQAGGYGYCLFGMKSFKSIKTKKETYNKYKNYYDNTGTDRNIIVSNSKLEGSYVLNTDWLEQLDIDEIEELLISPSLFLVDENNNTIPVYIESVEKIINDKSQDKLVQYEIEVKEAINRNVIS